MPKATILPMAKQGACQLGSEMEKRRGAPSLATGCAVGSVTFFDGCDSVEGLGISAVTRTIFCGSRTFRSLPIAHN